MIIPNNFALLSTLPVLVFLISLLSTLEAQENATESNGPKFLAIQYAGSGSINKINATTHSLELNDVSDKIILFSDRPDRIVTTINISDFVGNWSTRGDSFQVDPPNAVLVALEESNQTEDTFVIELYNPNYDRDTNKLSYEITLLPNRTASALPEKIGQSSLVIDKFDWPATPSFKCCIA